MGAREINIALLIAVVCSLSSCREEETIAGSFLQTFPTDRSKEVSLTPTMKWNAALGASGYEIILSLKEDFSSEEGRFSASSTEYTIDTPLKRGYRYYWKVIARNDAGETVAENAGISFRTIAPEITSSPGVSKYYVSLDGIDNPDRGSLQNPFRTVSYACTRVPSEEGDTVLIGPGIFHEDEAAVVPIGVNIVGSGVDQTILSSSGVLLSNDIDIKSPDFKLWYDGALIQLTSPHHIIPRNVNSIVYEPAQGNQVISNFSIDGNNKKLKAGVWVENRSNVTMHHVSFKNLAQRGAVFAPGNKKWFEQPTFYMTGIKIYDCEFINSGKDLSDESLGNLCIAQLDGAEIYNIRIQDTEGYGIKFIYDGYFKNTIIHDCEISLNEVDAKWGEDIAIELWNVGPGNKIDNIICNTWLSIVNHPEVFGTPTGTENMKVTNVRMIDQDGTSNKEAVEIGAPGVEVKNSYFENKGFGIAIWDMGRSNIVVRNNIFYNSIEKSNWASGAAVYIDNSRTWTFDNIKIFNNVFDTHRVAVKIKGGNIDKIDIINNAFLNTGIADVESEGLDVTLSHNLKYKAGGAAWIVSGVSNNNNNLNSDPQYTRAGLRYNDYYKPVINSFSIDKGVDVGYSFNGIAPDIGAVEF